MRWTRGRMLAERDRVAEAGRWCRPTPRTAIERQGRRPQLGRDVRRRSVLNALPGSHEEPRPAAGAPSFCAARDLTDARFPADGASGPLVISRLHADLFEVQLSLDPP